MAPKIKRFFECYIPVTACNLRCDYCYIIQASRNTGKFPKFNYSPEHIGRALTRERLGGVCYFSICGGGETLFPNEMVQIINELLSNGHYVNITTNGTYSRAFEKILKTIPKEDLKRLHFAFSLHYNELLRLSLLDVFAENVKRMKQAGCSILVQMNLYDGYLPRLEEIKKYCLFHFGALPQIAATRLEGTSDYRFHTALTIEEYRKKGMEFRSPLFDFTMRNFNIKRHEYCYAGQWSALINLATGIMNPCYSCGSPQNIFEDISNPIRFCPVGYGCQLAFCVNSSHFLSLGTIPSLFSDVTYAGLRNRTEAGWYSDEMKEFLSAKLCESNNELSSFQLKVAKIRWLLLSVLKKSKSKMREILEKN